MDQVERVVAKLAAQPFSRQAQMVTWMPAMDLDAYDPPCLQSLWYRLVRVGEGYRLVSNVRFRSNDAWGANFMNMFGFTHFSRLCVADPLQERLGCPVSLGRMNWQADSYHIYGKDRAAFQERLLKRLGTTRFEDRVYAFRDEAIQEIWVEAEATVREKIARYDREHAESAQTGGTLQRPGARE